MSSTNEGILNTYAADVAMTAVFGLGYYIINKFNNKNNNNNKLNEKTGLYHNKQLIKENLIKSLTNYSNITDIEELNKALKEEFPNKNVCEILSSLQQKDIVPNVDTYNSLISIALSDNDDESIEILQKELLDELMPVFPNHITFNLLINAINLKQNNTKKNNNNKINNNNSNFSNYFDKELISLIKAFEGIDINLDISCQNSILKSLVQQKRLNDAWNQYTNMKNACNPDLYTSRTLLEGILANLSTNSNSNNMSELWLERTLEVIDESSLNLITNKDSDLVSLLIKACYECNRLDKAEYIYNSLIKENTKFTINEEITCLVIDCYAKDYKLKKAIKVFNNYINNSNNNNDNNNNELNITLYKSIISACIKCTSLDKAITFFNNLNTNIENSEFISKDIELSMLDIYSIMTQAYYNNNKFTESLNIFNIVFSTDLKTKITDEMLKASILSMFNLEKYSDIENTIQILKAEDSNIISISIYKVLVECYIKQNNLNKINELYTYLTNNHNTKLDSDFYNVILNYFITNDNDDMNNKQASIDVYNQMLENNLKPSNELYSNLIHLYCSLGNAIKSYEIFENCIRKDISLSYVTYEVLIKAQIRGGFIDRGVSLFKNMIVKKMTVTVELSEAMIKISIKNSREKDACDILSYAIELDLELDLKLIELFVDLLTKDETVRIPVKIALFAKIKKFYNDNDFNIRNELENGLNRYNSKQSNNNNNNTSLNNSQKNSINSNEKSIYGVSTNSSNNNNKKPKLNINTSNYSPKGEVSMYNTNYSSNSSNNSSNNSNNTSNNSYNSGNSYSHSTGIMDIDTKTKSQYVVSEKKNYINNNNYYNNGNNGNRFNNNRNFNNNNSYNNKKKAPAMKSIYS